MPINELVKDVKITEKKDDLKYQVALKYNTNETKKYSGLKVIEETKFNGGTSVKYWM